MLKYARSISSEVENYSIDEFFMAYYGKDPDKVGEETRRYVKKQFGITAPWALLQEKS